MSKYCAELGLVGDLLRDLPKANLQTLRRDQDLTHDSHNVRVTLLHHSEGIAPTCPVGPRVGHAVRSESPFLRERQATDWPTSHVCSPWTSTCATTCRVGGRTRGQPRGRSALRKKFARAEAQKSKINCASSGSCTAEIRVHKIPWESVFLSTRWPQGPPPVELQLP